MQDVAPLLDAQGSVRALSTSSATLSDQYSYTAFGETRSQTGSSPQPYGYTGQQRDAATGLYYLCARYYAPGMGRFLSRDTWPIQVDDPREINRYGYVANDPINYTDPSGWVALGEYGAANNETSKGAREYHAYQRGVELPKEFTAREIGKYHALRARTINNQLRAELTELYGKTQANYYMRNITVGSARINGTEYVSINSEAPKQVVNLLRSQHGDFLVVQRGAHAEQALYMKAREVLGTRNIDVIAEKVQAIGVSHTQGPCPSICQPFFADTNLPIYWMGRISRAFASLTAGL